MALIRGLPSPEELETLHFPLAAQFTRFCKALKGTSDLLFIIR